VFSAEDGKQPTKDYLATSRLIAERQLVRAGYRLANVIKLIFED
jgi:hypothetical protein